MVIHEATSTSATEQSKLDIKATRAVKQHVCVELKQNQNKNTMSYDCDKAKTEKKNVRKSMRRSLDSNSETIDKSEVTQINETDLEELRTVYKKCKAVMKKIESKYGHLLDLEEVKGRKRKKKASVSEESDNNECTCPINKKIVFDDDGKEIALETDLKKHICLKKLKRTQSTENVSINHVQVEYDVVDTSLPDNLVELSNILHDPNIDVTYRNKVIHKIKLLKQEYIDEVRFNKHALIEKLKLDPDEILDFKGTNLKSLPGYIVN